jgi:hypothetical protein
MSSSSSSSRPSRAVHRSKNAQAAKAQKLDFSSKDCTFVGYGNMPNMNKHVSNQQQVRLQATWEVSAFFTQSSTIPVFGSRSFQLSDFTGSSGMQSAAAAFDQYRIDLIEVWLISRDPTGVNASNPGLITSSIDLDDVNTPTSIANLQQYASSITSSGAACHYHRWVPHAAMDLYTGSFNGFGNVASPWIDSGSQGVQHYGFKMASSAGSSSLVYDLVTRVTVSFRGLF